MIDLQIKKPIHFIGLNGNPHRNGNVATLMNWVLEGCKEAGAKVELINVIDHHIQYCEPCHTCIHSGDCPINDGMIKCVLN